MNFPKTVLLVAILTTLIPVVAVLVRGRTRRYVTWATVLTAATVSFFLAIVIRLNDLRPEQAGHPWVLALVASTVPLLLAGYLLSVTFGREQAERSIRHARRTLVYLVVGGAGFLVLLRHGSFLTDYDPGDGRGVLHLGSLGKAFLSYLLVGLVLVGYNFERTYRTASHDERFRLRLPLLGLFALLGYLMFILANGMLYASVGLGKLVSLALPVTLASMLFGYGYLRGAITDVAAPVSRSVVYSSFTALAVGLFVLCIALAAQIATVTKWSPDEILVVTFVFLGILVGALLLFSNRFQRRLRRFIDRNFYVNRYDYRTQWAAMNAALEHAADRAAVLGCAGEFLRDVFGADGVTISLRGEGQPGIQPVYGKGSGTGAPALTAGSPLGVLLVAGRKALLLDRTPHDFTYIPVYAENGDWLEATASQILAPLLEQEELTGTIGLERTNGADPFTYEDVALLDSIAAHIGAALRSVRLASDLADTREMELMSQWSSLILHDLKNYLTPLRMAAGNLLEYRDDPEVVATCARDIGAVTERMEKLVHTLSELRRDPTAGMEAVCPNQALLEVLASLKVADRPGVTLQMALEASCAVRANRGMLRRVLENLVTNALEAMPGGGTLEVRTADGPGGDNGDGGVTIRVRDTGAGIPEAFLRERLFRPFATTKKKGMGLGLYQCRSISRAHGGELSVESRMGEGTTFQVKLRRAGAPGDASGPERPVVPLRTKQDAEGARVAS